MKTLSLVMSFMIIVLIGCKKNDESLIVNSGDILGYWANPVMVDTLWKYERVNSLDENGYSFSFKQSQIFQERKNAGWCGTPPISYDNFDGIWTRNNDILNINVDYWGGTADYQWKIISIDNSNMVLYKIKEQYNFENKNF